MAANVEADLARILATLQQQQQQQQQQYNYLQPTQLSNQQLHHELFPAPIAHPQQQQQTQDPRTKIYAPAVPSAPTRPDPRTIKTLPAANRYITHHLSNSAETLTALRALKGWQHAKERSWHAGRQELLKRHAERPANEAKLAAFLASIGQTANPAFADTMLGEKEELRNYDRMVLQKCGGMVREMERELARLGVPLFCEDVEYDVGDKELRKWRGRVVELLEDLCEEETGQ